MTGIYVRIERDGRWLNLEVEQLTNAELTVFFASMDAPRLRSWARTLAGWIRDNVKIGNEENGR